jgi:NADH:ubiquinone oxidoreductase subunit D
MAEIKQSINLCLEVINNIQNDYCFFDNETLKHEDYKIQPPMKLKIKNSMENLIAHFKLYSEGFCIVEEELYTGVEAPKGEFGVYLETDGTNKLNRCKIKSPGFFHLQGIDFMSYNHLLADIVTIIGTQDIVSGEIDR